VNDTPREHIPGRRRRLVILLTIAVAAGLAAGAVVVVNAGGGGGGTAAQAASCRPLKGTPPLTLDLPGGLPAGGNAAVLAAAERALPANDARVAVAKAVNGYPAAGAATTLSKLHALDQGQPAVRLYEGLVELWSGSCGPAQHDLQQVRTSNLYGFYGTIADNTLHASSQRAGYPLYLPPDGTPTGTTAQLRARVRAHPADAGAWLGLAYEYERQWLKHQVPGQRRDAIAAAQRALQADPTAVSPRVAVAVLSYDKDRPGAPFPVLGPLIQQTSDPTEIRFHLGELLFWNMQDTDAAAQWRQVVDDAPNTVYGRTAAQLLKQIS
jgi:hypothetical protein